MKQVLLSDVCEINPRIDSGISDDAECSFVPMEYVDDISGTIANTSIRKVGDVKKGYTFFKNDDVIFAKITPCMENGKCAIGKNLKNGIAFGSTEYHVVRAKEEIIPEWVYYYLRQEHVRQSATHWFRGTAGQQRVPATFLEELKIPLPPLTEQKRIASLLARADRLRTLRRTAHELGESLLQSVFLEMFEKAKGKMKEVRLETLAEVKTGGTPSREIPEYFDGQIPWVKTTEVINEVIYDTSEKISKAGLKASNCEVFPVDTILLAMYGQGLTRGRTGKLAIPATTNQACAAILPSPKINTDYLWTFLKLSYNEIRDLGRGGNQPNLNLSMVRDLVIPVPPLSLQEEFAGVVARVESLRGRMGESTRQVEGLFESLLSEAFNA